MLTTLILIIYVFSTSIEYEVDETLKELVPNNFYFYYNSFNYFKILKYIPSCDNNSTTKNVYLQFDKGELYLYYNFSDIKQNEKYEFINYNEYLGDYSNLLNNLICEKEYYFV